MKIRVNRVEEIKWSCYHTWDFYIQYVGTNVNYGVSCIKWPKSIALQIDD